MKTSCILVLYNPNPQLIGKVIEAVMGQVGEVVAVDNSLQSFALPPVEGLRYINMGGNAGIAAAQNAGLEDCLGRGAEFVFFLDQDSIVEPDMVARLHASLTRLHQVDVVVGAVGPRPVNRQNDKKYVGSVKKGVEFLPGLTEVTEIINSGSLIPAEAFRTAGLMDASLFIDGVDHEWCWRAHFRGGYRFFIDEGTLLSHQLGEGDRRLLMRKVAIPTPFRTYYQFRNYFWLLRRGYVPLYWKVSNGVKYFVKLFYFPLFVAPRGKYLSNILRGIRDGICMKTYFSR